MGYIREGFMGAEVKISRDVKAYLDDIAEKLWSQPSHAAIMVGAGFSKNASLEFPDWYQLGDEFYHKLYGTKPSNLDVKYSNVLKLADGVESAFGRPTLNHLLLSKIPNAAVEPSKLHYELLELPWVDVFTTNYDTLLERATKNISSRRYDIVVNQNELVYSNPPRIIKLHGSFPSVKPFIITEEDYRKYPKEFAPFVNTVQQSLLENTLCLIGFSGDDPNFLSWVGWIRDNLGEENSPIIYLVGMFNYSDADLKLLKRRNIVVVNLRLCAGVNDHAQALNVFFEYLNDKKRNNTYDPHWPNGINLVVPKPKELSTENNVSDFVEFINNLKISYPGWLIAPSSVRQKLWNKISRWVSYLSVEKEISIELRLKYLSSVSWCLDVCLRPVFDDLALVMEDTLKNIGNDFAKYNFDEITITKLSLVRYYREESKWDKWEKEISKLKNNRSNLSTFYLNQMYYEECLGYFAKLNIKLLSSLIKDWEPSINYPVWMLRKASLLAEVDDLEQAKQLSNKALSTIRDKLNLAPISNNLELLSLESYAMMLVRFTYVADEHKLNDEFSERWRELSAYECDPWKELDYFDLVLAGDYQEPKHEKKQYNFDIGSISRTYTDAIDVQALEAMSLIRMLEYSGLPIRINHSVIRGESVFNALSPICNYYPFLANFTLLRLASSKNTKKFFTRKTLLKIPCDVIENCVSVYMNALRNIPDTRSYNGWKYSFCERLRESLPEVLSILLSKLNYDKVFDVFSYFCEEYSSKNRNNYIEVEKVFKRTANVVPCSLLKPFIEKACSIRYQGGYSDIDDRNLLPPIWYFNIPKELPFSVRREDVIYFLSLMDDEIKIKRRLGFMSLVKLYELGALDNEQENEFANKLWPDSSPVKVPETHSLLISSLLSLPFGKKNEVKIIIKESILSLDFPVRGDSGTYSMVGGNINVIDEFMFAKNYLKFEKSDIESLFDKINSWWHQDKIYTNVNNGVRLFGSTADEFKLRFNKLVVFLYWFVVPEIIRIGLDRRRIGKLQDLVDELQNYGFSTLRLKSLAPKLFNTSYENVLNEINDGLISDDEALITDSCLSILGIVRGDNEADVKPCLTNLINKILMYGEPELSFCIDTLECIIKEKPEIFDEKDVRSIGSAINRLEIKTKLNVDDDELTVSKKILLRRQSSKLAKSFSESDLFVYGKDTALSRWKSLSDDIEEFSEIKRDWID